VGTVAREVRLNDFERLWAETGPEVLAAVRAVGESGWYVLGAEVRRLEAALAPVLGRTEVIGCGSGLDAIEIALRAAGLVPGAKVLTTPLTAFATSLAVVRAGGVPVFVDVDEHGLLDLDRCAAALEADRAVRALVPVHLFGNALDLERLAALRDRFDLLVVEDCAQSIGASWRGRLAGTVGRLAATSFYPTKNLGALGDGGAVATDDPALAARCRSLRDYGQSAKYVHEVLGMNSRLDELHAAVLARAFLPRLPRWTARRREIAGAYAAGIENPRVRPVGAPAGSEGVAHLFPVRVPAAERDAFVAHLRARGVLAGIHYPRLVPEQRALPPGAFEVRGSLARAAALAAAEVSLPIHPYLEDAEVARVLDAVNGWEGA
jgi:dTDP-3-amino-3,4,6-trideoxy-alpha-D-glucose transaminase